MSVDGANALASMARLRAYRTAPPHSELNSKLLAAVGTGRQRACLK
jgi:hypothetical protein